MKKIISFLIIFSVLFLFSSCKKKYMVWIGYEITNPHNPYLPNKYHDTIYIKAKNDSQAYEKALKVYYKIKKDLGNRNYTDTTLLKIKEDYLFGIHGVNVFYKNDYLNLMENERIDIEAKVLELYHQNKLDE